MHITIPPDALGDRLVAHWALERIGRLRRTLPDAADQLSRGFTEVVLRRLLDTAGTDERMQLFRTIPPSGFSGLVDELIERWPNEPRSVAWRMMETLARLAPDRAAEMLEAWYAAHSLEVEIRSLTGLTGALLALPDRLGGQVAAELLEFVLDFEDVNLLDLLRADLITLVRRHGLPGMTGLVDGLFDPEDGSRYLHREALAQCYTALTDGLPFFAVIERHSLERSYQRLEPLHALFHPTAPLAKLDALASSRAQVLSSSLEALFPETSDYPEALDIGRHLVAPRLADGSVEAERLGAFPTALCVAAHARRHPEWTALSATEIAALGAADLENLPDFDGALDRLRQLPPRAVSDALEAALLENEESQGAATLARWMGALGHADSIRPLRASLDSSLNEALVDAAAEALIGYGAAAEEAFVNRWEELTEAQQEYGAGILELIGGERTIRMLVERQGDLRDPTLAKQWIQIARGLPDAGLLKILDAEPADTKNVEAEEVCLVHRVLLGADGSEQAQLREAMVEKLFGKGHSGPEDAVWAADSD